MRNEALQPARYTAAATGGRLRRALFLCSANYYWSRLCEELFNHHAAAARLNWQALSRAVRSSPANLNSGPMSPFATDFLRTRGIRPSNHLRLPLEVTAFDFATSDLVFAVHEPEHRATLEQRWPEMAAAIRYWDIGSLDSAAPGVARARLDDHVGALIRWLATGYVPGAGVAHL
jgi:protein-tyrosine-phosphatase